MHARMFDFEGKVAWDNLQMYFLLTVARISFVESNIDFWQSKRIFLLICNSTHPTIKLNMHPTTDRAVAATAASQSSPQSSSSPTPFPPPAWHTHNSFSLCATHIYEALCQALPILPMHYASRSPRATFNPLSITRALRLSYLFQQFSPRLTSDNGRGILLLLFFHKIVVRDIKNGAKRY